MSQKELERFYQQIEQCSKKTAELNQRLQQLEEKKDQLPLEEYLDKFEQIRKEALELNLEKDRIGRELEAYSSDSDS